jgi:hypothetical protein
MAGQTMDKSITENCSGSSRNSSQVMYEINFKIIGNCIKRNIMPVREPEKECEACDKDDRQIEMPDGDEIVSIYVDLRYLRPHFYSYPLMPLMTGTGVLQVRAPKCFA